MKNIHFKYRNFATILMSVALLFAAGCDCCKVKETQSPPPADNSKSLFDGKTLKNWEVTNFGPQGEVVVENGTIILGMGDGCTGITYKGNDFPKVNYEVSLLAKRIDGNDFFCGMTFPVKDEFCSLICGGWGGTVVGISSIDGFDAANNSYAALKQFNKNQWYKIKVRVTAYTIDVWIDQEHIIELVTVDRKLSIRAEVELSKPFGIASWCTMSGLKDIKVRMLDKAEIAAAKPKDL